MSFDINVLVNGTRCKLYNHRGKTFVEAKEGSEYVLEIKNNSWEKILAVVSVDGLNVVDGKAADEHGPGYVMDRYTAQKLYGFQYSPEKVASFKFGAMGATTIDPKTGEVVPLGYAASKKDGSEKNTGVIGVRIWDEVPKPPPPPNPAPVYTTTITTTTTTSVSNSYAISASWSATSMHGTGAMSVNAAYSPNPQTWNAGGLYGPGRFGYSVATSAGDVDPNTGQPYSSLFGGCAGTPTKSSTVNTNTRVYPNSTMGNLLREAIADAKAVRATACSNLKSADIQSFACQVEVETPDEPIAVACACAAAPAEAELDMASFDMETQWGSSRTYKVKETTFERREVIHSFDIYYASRESLIAMGVDLGTEKRVSFPESFKENKYAKPPKGWRA